MIKFKNIENIVSYMFDHLNNDDNLASVIGNRQLIIDIIQELLNYKNVVISQCLINYDEFDDKEYILYLYDDTDSDKWYINVEVCSPAKNGKYLAVGGYVLFHEDVNSKILIDMQNNKFMPLCGHDWFIVNENASEKTHEEDPHKSYDSCRSGKSGSTEKDCETLFIYRNHAGDPEGFSRSWTTSIDGNSLYCSQTYHSIYPNVLYRAAACLGVELNT